MQKKSSNLKEKEMKDLVKIHEECVEIIESISMCEMTIESHIDTINTPITRVMAEYIKNEIDSNESKIISLKNRYKELINSLKQL